MELRYVVSALSAWLTCANVALAEADPPASPDDPAKVGLMTPAAKSELDTCVAQAAQSAGDDHERRAVIGVFIGSNGRAVSLAILESSGLQHLDRLVLRCVVRASYTPAASDGLPIQWFFKTVLKAKHAAPETP